MEHKPTSARCLRMHADYLCRHAGACCTAGWAIPVEAPVYERLTVHFAGRDTKRLFAVGSPLPEGAAAVLAFQGSGACVFFEEDRGRLCAIHRELGRDCLPVACQQFPRVVLQDRRGTLISLSHFCPTAAGLLKLPTAAAFEIVQAPATITLDGDVEGLSAGDALPPLLRPGMLTDLDGYDTWERRAIGVLARGDRNAEEALSVLSRATLAIQCWRPGAVNLRETVDREFDVASAGKPDEDLDGIVARARLALGSVPPGLRCTPLVDDFPARRPDVPAWWGECDGAVRGYLAARLFGNWIAYYGQGLDTIVEYLQVALAVVKIEVAKIEAVGIEAVGKEAVRHHARESPSSPWQTVKEAIRNADLLLVHLSDPKRLSRLLDQSLR